MDKDGGLKVIFRAHLPEFHWQAIESALTGAGTPDTNYCHSGVEGWIEYKRAEANRVVIDKFQVAWHERRLRAGGRVFLAVRLLASAGPRRGEARDELFLYRGSDTRRVFLEGLRIEPLVHSAGGPARWNWMNIQNTLLT